VKAVALPDLRGDPFNVGQMYSLFADTIRQSSDAGRELPVA